MNALRTRRHLLLQLLATATLALGLAGPSGTAADKGAERLQGLHSIAARSGSAKPEAARPMVMACAQCQTVLVPTVDRTKGREIVTRTAKHLCPDCGASLETSGHGKMKVEAVKHSCSGCGEAAPSCCGSASPGQAAPAAGAR